MFTLVTGFTKQGYQVDLLLVVKRGELLEDVPPSARLIELGYVSQWPSLRGLAGCRGELYEPAATAICRQQPKAVRSLPRLVSYLRRERPDALLTTLPNNNS